MSFGSETIGTTELRLSSFDSKYNVVWKVSEYLILKVKNAKNWKKVENLYEHYPYTTPNNIRTTKMDVRNKVTGLKQMIAKQMWTLSFSSYATANTFSIKTFSSELNMPEVHSIPTQY